MILNVFSMEEISNLPQESKHIFFILCLYSIAATQRKIALGLAEDIQDILTTLETKPNEEELKRKLNELQMSLVYKVNAKLWLSNAILNYTNSVKKIFNVDPQNIPSFKEFVTNIDSLLANKGEESFVKYCQSIILKPFEKNNYNMQNNLDVDEETIDNFFETILKTTKKEVKNAKTRNKKDN